MSLRAGKITRTQVVHVGEVQGRRGSPEHIEPKFPGEQRPNEQFC